MHIYRVKCLFKVANRRVRLKERKDRVGSYQVFCIVRVVYISRLSLDKPRTIE